MMMAATRGSGRPAAAAACLIRGATSVPIVAAVAQTVTVPSASSPASASICGPRADSRTGGGGAPGVVKAPAADRLGPW